MLRELADAAEKILEGPIHWPRRARRIFVLTLPISGPLYLALCCILLLGLAAAATVLGPIIWIGRIWHGETGDTP